MVKLMYRIAGCGLVLMITCSLWAQTPTADGTWRLSWYDTSTQTEEVADFDTLEDVKKFADEAFKRQINLTTKGLLHTNITVKFVGKPSERKPGATLAEYKKNIEEAYRRARQLKADMLSATKAISEKSFGDANRAIKQFNSDRQDAIGATGYAFSEFPELSAVSRQDIKITADAATEEGVRKYTVLVYQSQGGKWVKQADRTFVTTDIGAAEAFIVKVKSIRGWTATSDLPPKPAVLPMTENKSNVKPTPAKPKRFVVWAYPRDVSNPPLERYAVCDSMEDARDAVREMIAEDSEDYRFAFIEDESGQKYAK